MGLITENPERYPESSDIYVGLMAIEQMWATHALQEWALSGINKYRNSRKFKKAMNKIRKESGVFWVITSKLDDREYNKQTGRSYRTHGGGYPSQKDAAYCLQILIMSGLMNPDCTVICKQTDELRLTKEHWRRKEKEHWSRKEIEEKVEKGELTMKDYSKGGVTWNDIHASQLNALDNASKRLEK